MERKEEGGRGDVGALYTMEWHHYHSHVLLNLMTFSSENHSIFATLKKKLRFQCSKSKNPLRYTVVGGGGRTLGIYRTIK